MRPRVGGGENRSEYFRMLSAPCMRVFCGARGSKDFRGLVCVKWKDEDADDVDSSHVYMLTASRSGLCLSEKNRPAF